MFLSIFSFRNTSWSSSTLYSYTLKIFWTSSKAWTRIWLSKPPPPQFNVSSLVTGLTFNGRCSSGFKTLNLKLKLAHCEQLRLHTSVHYQLSMSYSVLIVKCTMLNVQVARASSNSKLWIALTLATFVRSGWFSTQNQGHWVLTDNTKIKKFARLFLNLFRIQIKNAHVHIWHCKNVTQTGVSRPKLFFKGDKGFPKITLSYHKSV